jgi:hypothetical protein
MEKSPNFLKSLIPNPKSQINRNFIVKVLEFGACDFIIRIKPLDIIAVLQ